MAHDVFISYAHQNKHAADALCATLEARRIRCWLAPRDVPPGAEWAAAINEAIGQSRVFVLIFSDFSNRSQQVIREVGLAVTREVAIIPLRLEDVPLSSSMEYFVSTCHWLDALSPPLQAHLDRLVSRVQALLQQGPAAEESFLVAPPGAAGRRPAALSGTALLARVAATASRLSSACTQLLGRARAALREPDFASHEAPLPSPAGTAPPGDAVQETPALDPAAYRAAIQRRVNARRQHRKARLTVAAGTLVLAVTLASALLLGPKVRHGGPAAGSGGAGSASGAASAETGSDGSASGAAAAEGAGPGAAQDEASAYPGGVRAENAEPAWEPQRIRNPVGSSEGAAAQRDRCQTQLKALARACLMYSMDYDETLPRANWAPAIYPYTARNDELYTCPRVRANGYAISSTALGRVMASFEHPAQTPLLFDSSVLAPSAVAGLAAVSYRHLGGANVARVDGSVRWVPPNTLSE